METEEVGQKGKKKVHSWDMNKPLSNYIKNCHHSAEYPVILQTFSLPYPDMEFRVFLFTPWLNMTIMSSDKVSDVQTQKALALYAL
jgi:hypothetical protein